jgi:hypothetical protein
MTSLSKEQLNKLNKLNNLVAKVVKAQQEVNIALDGNEELLTLVDKSGALQRLEQWEKNQYHLKAFANSLNIR